MSYGETYTVLRGHLELIEEALEAATSYHVADDEARRWKNIGGVHQPSHLAVKLETALDRVQGYLGDTADASEAK